MNVGDLCCWAKDSQINNTTAVLRGLIYSLVYQQPSFILHIQKKHDHAGKALFKIQITYLIIDALDKCVADILKLLDLLIMMLSMSSRVKWNRAGYKVRLSLKLNAESVSAAVRLYILLKMTPLVQEKKYDNKTKDSVLSHLFLNANDTFLWVSLVHQNISNLILWKVLAKFKTFLPRINSLYEQTLEHIRNPDDADLCRSILALIATAYRPITIGELNYLIKGPKDMANSIKLIREIIGFCGSLVMSRTLQQDMYNLGAFVYPTERVKLPDPDLLI
ncbi:uncharacterized protein BDR25DRAFT_353606 [Lindgomyces ingoldianus]|uniref:Uncharacterized protein n=1 Tax=Lindgomyces ingoldianus TaxID=673940 RepID=A0ACB6R165_9PLEO|nr:uncharacterized protein BDR25DRAFT_353606 [Lindgomyces ingoldianus]KAF2472568.1 hypothetical protein BDR25DRAFT_353606 [Lindgomyces ingoldianus]